MQMDIKAHPFFAELDFAALVVSSAGGVLHCELGYAVLQSRTCTSPWVPPLRDSLDVSNFDEYPEEDEVRESDLRHACSCVSVRIRLSHTVMTDQAGMLLFSG